jgi:pimeloyl-ACP methyl ester carboxylesterase
MSGIECMARLAALVPPPRFPLWRYHGVLAPASPWRSRVVPHKPATTNARGAHASAAKPTKRLSGERRERHDAFRNAPAQRVLGNINWFYDAACPIWDSDVGHGFRTDFATDIPTLLIHGDWDTSTPLENAQELLPTSPAASSSSFAAAPTTPAAKRSAPTPPSPKPCSTSSPPEARAPCPTK